MIVFADTHKQAKELIANSFGTFASEHPDVHWSTFALYACPWAGWIVSGFDTEEKSAQIVAQFASEGPNWYGQDGWGRFNNNCPDFQFFAWRSLELPQWQTEYEGTDPIHVRDLDGRDHYIGSENEAFNGLTFNFLRTVLLGELKTLNQADPIFLRHRRRFGIQLLDSTFVGFWPSETINS